MAVEAEGQSAENELQQLGNDIEETADDIKLSGAFSRAQATRAARLAVGETIGHVGGAVSWAGNLKEGGDKAITGSATFGTSLLVSGLVAGTGGTAAPVIIGGILLSYAGENVLEQAINQYVFFPRDYKKWQEQMDANDAAQYAKAKADRSLYERAQQEMASRYEKTRACFTFEGEGSFQTLSFTNCDEKKSMPKQGLRYILTTDSNGSRYVASPEESLCFDVEDLKVFMREHAADMSAPCRSLGRTEGMDYVESMSECPAIYNNQPYWNKIKLRSTLQDNGDVHVASSHSSRPNGPMGEPRVEFFASCSFVEAVCTDEGQREWISENGFAHPDCAVEFETAN